MVQWLRLHAPNAGGPGSIPGQGTRSHMSQLKTPHALTKTRCSQINKYLKQKNKKPHSLKSCLEVWGRGSPGSHTESLKLDPEDTNPLVLEHLRIISDLFTIMTIAIIYSTPCTRTQCSLLSLHSFHTILQTGRLRVQGAWTTYLRSNN